MKLILLTADDCDLCHDAEERMKKELWRELDNKEIEIVNLDQDEKAQELWMENDLPLAPLVVLVTETHKVISYIDAKEFFKGLKEAQPAPTEAVTAP